MSNRNTWQHHVPFVSQRQGSHARYGCGVAATMMLLKHRRAAPTPRYSQLCSALQITTPPSQKAWWYEGQTALGAYPEDVTRYLRSKSLPYLATYKRSRHRLAVVLRRLRNGPVMVGMKPDKGRWGSSGHWIVLVGREETDLRYLDPQFRAGTVHQPRTITLAEFWRHWDGCSIQIAPA